VIIEFKERIVDALFDVSYLAMRPNCERRDEDNSRDASIVFTDLQTKAGGCDSWATDQVTPAVRR
jgi:hypothetical protein